MTQWIAIESPHKPRSKAARDYAQAVTRGLLRPDVRAFVFTVGTLEQLPTDRARARVLQFVADYLNDPTP